MNEVIVINEECHGFIGIARDVPSAIDFLYEKDWLWGKTEILIAPNEWRTVEDAFGKNWKAYLEMLPLSMLADIFEGCFYFHKEIVH